MGTKRIGACWRHEKRLRAMALAGATFQEIAEAIGTSRHRVSEFVKRQGVQRAPHRTPPPGRVTNRCGPMNPAWKGGRTVDKQGYVLIWLPEHPHANRHGYVRRHRLVMEKHLGRHLDPREVVHHKNGRPGDDRIENLGLYPTNGEHLRDTLTGVPCPARGRRRTSTPAQ